MIFSFFRYVRLSVLAVSLLLGCFSASVLAKEAMPSKAHIEAANELMKVTKADKNFEMAVGMTMKMQKQAMPTVEPKRTKIMNQIFEEVQLEMMESTKTVMDAMAIIYAKHLSVTDLQSIIAFYKSPAGQRLVVKQPVIIRESMAFGQKWGMELGAKVTRRIREKAKEKGLKL